MSLRKRVEDLERAARQRSATAPPAWTGSEEERLRLVMELFALGKLRLEQDEREPDGVREVVPDSVVKVMSDDELLAVLGFPSKEEFVRHRERYRIEQAQRPKLSHEEERRRVIEVLRSRRPEDYFR